MVPQLSIIFMCVVLAFVAAVSTALPIVIKRKWHVAVTPYFIGCATFVIFALVLESIMHNIVLGLTGDAITGNTWLYALYGGLAAGVFEETGRLLAMKLVMKKYRSNPHSALMYGAGHGCGEAVLLVGITMLGNIVYSVMINTGSVNSLLTGLTAEQTASVQDAIKQLCETPSYMWLLSAVERAAAITLHISLSVLVWTAVVRKRMSFYIIAILVHALVDGAVVIIQQNGVNSIVLEAVVLVMSALAAWYARSVWKRELKETSSEPTAQPEP